MTSTESKRKPASYPEYAPEPAPDAHLDDWDDSMGGDHESALASAGWGTDEDYGFFGDDGGWGE